ncbi:hypothetical protein SAMN05660297_03187 [Natronincola peptidivorans]|uniref:DUF5105 domain-containing protein n=1 Tax=Natronincola peptidivorans TaxID=426128 RepID=A0A1I0GGM5_9FIRM|nr:hypothetical protein [Natronincola peptidivorans]SET70039.1 hypothetical protein SAMN05660297_03187 [Natronincola peptidivorans]
MKKIITLTMTIVLLLVMTLSLAGCGGDESATADPVSLVDVTTEQGISLKLPSDLAKQDNGAYANMETGDNAGFGVTEIAGAPLSSATEEDVVALYQSKYDDVVVTSFENGIQINGKEALVSQVNLTTPGGHAITLTLVMVTDDTNNYIGTFIYGKDKTDGALYKNLQACIDSITIAGTPDSTAASAQVGTSVKDDLSEYLYNNFGTVFEPEDRDIIETYEEAILTGDSENFAKALSDTLPAKNNALLEKLKAYTPQTTEVQELHNLFIQAIELRKDAYTQLVVVMAKQSTEAEIDAAFVLLDEYEAKIDEFLTKGESMKKDLGV